MHVDYLLVGAPILSLICSELVSDISSKFAFLTSSRPLPEELKRYARADTHYLIYIYERMRNALLEAANGQTNLLEAVYQRSTSVCKRRYVKFILRDDSHMELYRKSKKMFNNRQMYALQNLFQWRDRVAREEDESTG